MLRPFPHDARLIEYVVQHGARETTVLRDLREETARNPAGHMQIGPDQGALLAMLVRIMGAERCIEVGVFTGYSALWVAAALPENGRIVACDVSSEWTAIARRYWEVAGVGQKIDLRLAPAEQTLDTLISQQKGQFDFAFIDADKENYERYYEQCLQLMRVGGLIAVDNVVWGGRVLESGSTDSSTRAIRAFNQARQSDARVDISMIPIGDGLTVLRKR